MPIYMHYLAYLVAFMVAVILVLDFSGTRKCLGTFDYIYLAAAEFMLFKVM